MNPAVATACTLQVGVPELQRGPIVNSCGTLAPTPRLYCWQTSCGTCASSITPLQSSSSPSQTSLPWKVQVRSQPFCQSALVFGLLSKSASTKPTLQAPTLHLPASQTITPCG